MPNRLPTIKLDREHREFHCLENPGWNDGISVSGQGGEIVREDDNTVVVFLANGGYVILSSASPILAVIEPNGGR